LLDLPAGKSVKWKFIDVISHIKLFKSGDSPAAKSFFKCWIISGESQRSRKHTFEGEPF